MMALTSLGLRGNSSEPAGNGASPMLLVFVPEYQIPLPASVEPEVDVQLGAIG